jgi:hypothetical protein
MGDGALASSPGAMPGARGGTPYPQPGAWRAPYFEFSRGDTLMAKDTLDGVKVAILVTDGFEEVELAKPREALDEAGATTSIVSPKDRSVRAWNFTDWSGDYPVDKRLGEARPDDYDALLLPGGVINPDTLRIEIRFAQCRRHMGRSRGRGRWQSGDEPQAGRPPSLQQGGHWDVREGCERSRRVRSIGNDASS